jgi:xylose isomerase
MVPARSERKAIPNEVSSCLATFDLGTLFPHRDILMGADRIVLVGLSISNNVRLFLRTDMNNKTDLVFGAGLWVFGQFVDRYATDAYGPPVGILEAIERAGQVGDLVALDINYPFDSGIGISEVRTALQRNGLRCHAITPASYSRKFQKGALTNPDPQKRREAIDLYKEAIPVARDLGAKYVKFWPGQDGYDYPFQADYEALWRHSVEAVREVALSDTGMQFAIECKSKEPRTHMFFCNVANTVLAIKEMEVENVGIVFDLGHSLFAKETPAEALQLAARYGYLTSVEVNDNWREWDDDMTVASVHLVESLEFLFALRKIGWDQPILLDQFPFREDPVAAARESIRTMRQLNALLDRLDLKALEAAQGRQDALAAQRLVLDLFLDR